MKRSKLFLRSIALILIISFMLPLHSFAESTAITATVAASKISIDLTEEFAKVGSDTKVPVNITLSDVPEEMVMDLFAKRYPYEYEVYL